MFSAGATYSNPTSGSSGRGRDVRAPRRSWAVPPLPARRAPPLAIAARANVVTASSRGRRTDELFRCPSQPRTAEKLLSGKRVSPAEGPPGWQGRPRVAVRGGLRCPPSRQNVAATKSERR